MSDYAALLKDIIQKLTDIQSKLTQIEEELGDSTETPVKEVLYNRVSYNHDCGVGGATTSSKERVEFDSPKSVTLHSGGVSGGLYWDNGGVPGVSYVNVCNQIGGPDQTCTKVALPLYSEITIEDVRVIELMNVYITVPCTSGEYMVSMASSVIYSTS